MKKILFIVLLLINNAINAFVPVTDQKKSDYIYQVSVVAVFKNEGRFLKEWVDFHRIAGVEHFLLYNNFSTDNWKEILAPYIKENIVEVFDWPTREDLTAIKNWIFLEKNISFFNAANLKWAVCQRNAYEDAIKRSMGISKWLAIIDLDEYLIPMQEKTIASCLETHFPQASAVYANWLVFGTSNVTLTKNDKRMLKLTHCSERSHQENSTGKSIVRPESVLLDNNVFTPSLGIHHFTLSESNYYYNGDGQVLDGLKKKNGHLTDQHHATFFRINHYKFGDEAWFKERRLKKDKLHGLNIQKTMNEYYAANKKEDLFIINFIKN